MRKRGGGHHHLARTEPGQDGEEEGEDRREKEEARAATSSSGPKLGPKTEHPRTRGTLPRFGDIVMFVHLRIVVVMASNDGASSYAAG